MAVRGVYERVMDIRNGLCLTNEVKKKSIGWGGGEILVSKLRDCHEVTPLPFKFTFSSLAKPTQSRYIVAFSLYDL